MKQLLFALILSFLVSESKLALAKNEHDIKFGAIPIASFDADKGLKYGAVINVLDYKPGTSNYSQYLYLSLSNSTKKTLNLQGVFESETLIPNSTTYIEAAYINDKRLGFFGFNGNQTRFTPAFNKPNNANFQHKNFYNINRGIIKGRFDVQRNIGNSNWRSLTGITYNKFMFHEIAEGEPSLYRKLADWNIIPEKEVNGGDVISFKIGGVYDSRDNKAYCTHGNWFEGFLVYSPNLMKDDSFTKLVLTYRYYNTIKEKTTFTFRISSQTKLGGTIPNYLLTNYYDTQLNRDGIGGAYTLRGIFGNRIASNGFLLGNFEIRQKILALTFLKLDWEVSGTLFTDMAYITQPYEYSLTAVPEAQQSIHFSDEKQPLYMGVGPGINFIYNKTNLIIVNYGFSVKKQYGNGGLYVTSRFLF